MPRLKRWLNVPAGLESVHTAKVGNYFIEGHVPAEDIKLLLKEMPKARGLAVPGLPRGAPGREQSNPFCETACTILDNASERTRSPARGLQHAAGRAGRQDQRVCAALATPGGKPRQSRWMQTV
jgi:hypothetical protein